MARGKKQSVEIEVRGLPIDVRGCQEEIEAALRYIQTEKDIAKKEAHKHALEIKRSETRMDELLKQLDRIRRGDVLPFPDEKDGPPTLAVGKPEVSIPKLDDEPEQEAQQDSPAPAVDLSRHIPGKAKRQSPKDEAKA